MAHEHPVVDADKHFLIDPVTRVVKNSESKKTTLVQNDHNSERLSFEVDRYIEGHDMLESANVRIHYDNVGTNRLKTSGVYEVDDIQPNPEDSTKVIFTWLISQNCTSSVGALNFSITFECETDGVVEYRWSTVLNTTDVYISEGLDNSGSVASTYVDILTKWKNELYSIVYTYPTFAEVCRWEDDNLDDEYRIGYFVTAEASDITEEVLMVKATAGSDIRGVTMESPGFAANAGDYKFDEKGELLPQYDYVGFSGFIPVIDNGLCSVNGWCKCGDNGTAIPADGATGFRVIERVDETHVLILVEPQGDIATLMAKDTEITEALANHVAALQNADTALRNEDTALQELINNHINANNPHGMSPESIGALPIVGGKLTGNLSLGDYVQMGGNNNAFILNAYNNDRTKSRQLLLTNVDYMPSLVNSIRLKDTVTNKTYNIYGEHNKPTIADVGGTNPNLLHNWYFGNLVNRNGKTSYTANGYTIDRWYINVSTGGSVNLIDGAIQIIGGTNATTFRQTVDVPIAEAYTCSFLCEITGGRAYMQVFYTDGTSGKYIYATANGLWSFQDTSQKQISRVQFGVEKGVTLTLYACKLELGDTQTLAHQDANGNWVLNEIPDYAEQIAICGQYDPTTGNYKGGYLSEAGGKMSGLLEINRATPELVLRSTNHDRYLDIFVSSSGLINIQNRQDNSNFQSIYLGKETGDIASVLQIERAVAGKANYYKFYHSGSITAGTTDLTAGTSALGTDCYYDVYE